MKKVLTIIWKDAILRFSEKSEILFFIVLPVVFTFLLGGLFSGGDDEDDRIPLLVVDRAGDRLSANLLSALESSPAVRSQVLSLAEAEARFADEDAPALLVIPEGFGTSLLAGEPADLEMRTLPNNPNALAAEQAVQEAAGTVSRPLAAAHASLEEAGRIQPFSGPAEREVYFSQSLEAAQEQFASAPERVKVTRPEIPAEAAGSSFDARAQASAGQLITWVFIPLLGASGLFAYERATGTLRRLLTTPTQKSTFLLGTIAGQLGLSLVQMVLLVGFGILVMKVNWGRSPAGLAVMLVCFGLASVALGVMLGTFIKTESQASRMSTMLGMTMALLGGCWYPLELFPPTVSMAVQVLPTTWAMKGLSDLILRGQGLVEILPEAGVLLGFAVVFFMIGVRRFRFE